MEKGYVQVTNQIQSWRSNPEKYPMSYATTEGGDGGLLNTSWAGYTPSVVMTDLLNTTILKI